MSGKEIQKQLIIRSQIQLDISSLADGTYVLKLVCGDVVNVVKFVKQ